ncbi:uncharacterized protein TRUGW13939_11246 [Talaromyces rugulosus]|uniref:Uncharacterized protein n=1 Tax=Talaromyces rugulosus TaxID=121627 RepID=A0A7H8RHL5_TALRU|nr:uncharacterized protein TRUGW13939_11246 [Talaromyces rugulosus]QKX64073.1 hypothetical protein TRUGW13939_11246 [Talaromyces rugulosus]
MYIYRGRFQWRPSDDTELFVVILPFSEPDLDDPIHIYWQRPSATAGQDDGHVLYQTFVTGTIRSAETAQVVFSCGASNSMTLEFELVEGVTKLKGRIRSPGGTVSEEMALLGSYFEKTWVPGSTDSPIPVVYTGVKPHGTPQHKDLMLLVLPQGFGDDLPVLAYWQQISKVNDKKLSYSARKKQLPSRLAPDAEDGDNYADELCAFFMEEDGSWEMDCSASATNNYDTLQLKVKTQDDGQENTFSLTKQPLLGPERRRRRRAIKNSHTNVQNNTNHVVVCTLCSSASALDSEGIAWAGLALTALLLLPLTPTTATAVGLKKMYDVAVTSTSAALAVIGVMDVRLKGGASKVTTLCPGDWASNISDGGFFHSVNSLAVVSATIEPSNMLTVWTGTASELGARDVMLADPSVVTWSKAFQINMPHGHHVVIERNLRIPGLKPYSAGEPLDSKTGLTVDQFALGIENKKTPAASSIKWYPTKLPKLTEHKRLFSYHPDWTFVITQDLTKGNPSHGKAGSFEVVSCLNGQALVKMHSSGVENDMASHGRGQLLSANVSTQDEVSTLIRANPGFFAYTWHWRGKMYENKRRLVAWQWNQNNHIEFKQPTDTPGSQHRKYTYFLVGKEHITTRQMMMEGA